MTENIIEVSIEHVVVQDRFRKDFGDIDGLAASIKELGLLQPIGIDSGYRLVFGERRLRACKQLGQDKVKVRFVNLDSLLKGELAENEFRKDFTPSERVAIGAAIEAELAQQADKRMKAGVANPVENFPQGGEKTRDLVAKATGFGNGKTYEQAKKVVQEAAPELVEAMDRGEASVSAAAALLSNSKEDQAKIVAEGKKAIQKAAKQAKAVKFEPVKPAGTPHVLRVINAMDILLRHIQSEGMDPAEMADVFLAEVDLSEPAIADRIKATLPVMRALGRIASDLEAIA